MIFRSSFFSSACPAGRQPPGVWLQGLYGSVWARFTTSVPFARPSALWTAPALGVCEILQGASMSENAAGSLGNLPRLPAISSALPPVFQRIKSSPQQQRTNAPTPRFGFLETWTHRPSQGLTRGFERRPSKPNSALDAMSQLHFYRRSALS